MSRDLQNIPSPSLMWEVGSPRLSYLIFIILSHNSLLESKSMYIIKCTSILMECTHYCSQCTMWLCINQQYKYSWYFKDFLIFGIMWSNYFYLYITYKNFNSLSEFVFICIDIVLGLAGLQWVKSDNSFHWVKSLFQQWFTSLIKIIKFFILVLIKKLIFSYI